MDDTKTIVIIPTINELSGLKKIIPKLAKLDLDILVVDDNSTDDSRKFLQDSKKNMSGRLNFIFRDKSHGFRAAYFAGFEKALDGSYQQIVMMDGDGAHDPEMIPKMLEDISAGFDLVIGSRYAKGGEVKSFSPWRRFTSVCSNWLIRQFVSRRILDWTSGFIAIRAELLKKIIKYDYARGFSFLVQIKRNAIAVGAKVTEIPIHFINPTNAKSKFNLKIAWEAFLVFVKIITSKDHE